MSYAHIVAYVDYDREGYPTLTQGEIEIGQDAFNSGVTADPILSTRSSALNWYNSETKMLDLILYWADLQHDQATMVQAYYDTYALMASSGLLHGYWGYSLYINSEFIIGSEDGGEE